MVGNNSPSKIDRVQLFADAASFPANGQIGIFYFAVDTGAHYTYNGTAYNEVPTTAGGTYTTYTDPALNAITQSDVDTYVGAIITLTTTGNDQTLPAPTDTSSNKTFTVVNNDTSTDPINIIGASTVVLSPGEQVQFIWDGTAWIASDASGLWADNGTDYVPLFTRGVDIASGEAYKINGSDIDDLYVRVDGSNYLIANWDAGNFKITTQDIDIDQGLLTIKNSTYGDYSIESGIFGLATRCETGSQNSTTSLYAFDGDGTDDVKQFYFAEGQRSVAANTSSLAVGYDVGRSQFELESANNGTGTLRALSLFVEGQTNQLRLRTDGEVEFAQGVLRIGDDSSFDPYIVFDGGSGDGTITYDESAKEWTFSNNIANTATGIIIEGNTLNANLILQGGASVNSRVRLNSFDDGINTPEGNISFGSAVERFTINSAGLAVDTVIRNTASVISDLYVPDMTNFLFLLNNKDSGQGVIDQQFSTTDNFSTGASSEWQSFTAQVSGKLNSVDVRIITLSGTPSTRVNIYQGTGTGGTLLSSSALVTLTTFNWEQFDLLTRIDVTSGQVYTIETVTTSGNAQWYVDTAGGYAGGQFSENASWDGNFRTYINNGFSVVYDKINNRVGIGTESPTVELDLVGALKVSGDLTLGGGLQAGSLKLDDTGADHTLELLVDEDLSADRQWKVKVNDADRTIDINTVSTVGLDQSLLTTDNVTFAEITGDKLTIDNIEIDGNSIYSLSTNDLVLGSNTDQNIRLDPQGTGAIITDLIDTTNYQLRLSKWNQQPGVLVVSNSGATFINTSDNIIWQSFTNDTFANGGEGFFERAGLEINSGGSATFTFNIYEGERSTGTGTITSSGTAVTGSGTVFTTELTTNDYIEVSGIRRKIQSITDNTNLVLETAFPSDISTPSFFVYSGELNLLATQSGVSNTAPGVVIATFDSPALIKAGEKYTIECVSGAGFTQLKGGGYGGGRSSLQGGTDINFEVYIESNSGIISSKLNTGNNKYEWGINKLEADSGIAWDVNGKMQTNDDLRINADNKKLLFGDGQDSSIYYDGTDLVINTQEVGSGILKVNDDTDVYAHIGRLCISSLVSDVTYLSHIDRCNSAEYALKQLQDGTTQLNSRAGKDLNLGLNNVRRAWIDATNADFHILNDLILGESTDAIIQHNSLLKGATSESLDDDASTDLPDSTSGFGTVLVGDSEEYAHFRWASDGTVVLIENTANVVNTDTDTNFCIFDNGTSVRLRNRLGSAKTIRLTYNYS